jgi:hypothetical protein
LGGVHPIRTGLTTGAVDGAIVGGPFGVALCGAIGAIVGGTLSAPSLLRFSSMP